MAKIIGNNKLEIFVTTKEVALVARNAIAQYVDGSTTYEVEGYYGPTDQIEPVWIVSAYMHMHEVLNVLEEFFDRQDVRRWVASQEAVCFALNNRLILLERGQDYGLWPTPYKTSDLVSKLEMVV